MPHTVALPSPRLAGSLAWLSLFALFAFPAFLIWKLVTGDVSQAYVAANPTLNIAAPPEGWRLWTLLGLDTVEILVTLAILWQVRGVFAAFARSGEPTRDVARRLYVTGLLLLFQALLAPLVRMAESVLLTLANEVGQRELSVSLGSTEVTLIIAGGLLICTGRALGHGAAAVDENRGFI
ncbi:MAG: hypothetical protein AAFP28_13095 [Pseudomonadota bacterium]